MPAHIYIRIGRYHDATLNNMKAADADNAFIRSCRSNSPIYLAGYMPHNWHFGRVTAAIEGWSEHATALAGLRAMPELETLSFFGRDGGAPLLAVAADMLAGEIALAAGDPRRAIEHLSAAVRGEDALSYTEPPDWFYPARHSLGFAQLAAGEPSTAEATYLADLEIMPENGWALLGLEQALRAQGRDAEADAAGARFRTAWVHADMAIHASRI